MLWKQAEVGPQPYKPSKDFPFANVEPRYFGPGSIAEMGEPKETKDLWNTPILDLSQYYGAGVGGGLGGSLLGYHLAKYFDVNPILGGLLGGGAGAYLSNKYLQGPLSRANSYFKVHENE